MLAALLLIGGFTLSAHREDVPIGGLTDDELVCLLHQLHQELHRRGHASMAAALERNGIPAFIERHKPQ